MSTVTLELMLPYPPTINTYWRKWRNRMIISKKGRAYRKEVVASLAVRRCKRFKDSRVGVCITAHPPDKRRRDLDNIPKALLDALSHADIWQDDEQIDDLRIIRGEKFDGGLVIVKVTELEKER